MCIRDSFGADPDAVIDHLDATVSRALDRTGGDAHVSAFRRELHSIVDQGAEDLAQTERVGHQRGRPAHVSGELDGQTVLEVAADVV